MNDIVDEMILKAFRIVTKGVRFLDVLEDDRRQRAPAVTVMATVLEEASSIPPTPPADSVSFAASHGRSQAANAGSRAGSDGSDSQHPPDPAAAAQTTGPVNKRLSSVYTPAATNGRRLSQTSPLVSHRLSASISHRVSLAGPSPLSRPQNLVLQRLNDSQDTFLSHFGSFIGRLHLQSQPRPHLALAVKQSASSGGQLLVVVDVVSGHSALSKELLEETRAAMYDRIVDLVHTARDILTSCGPDTADIITQQDNSRLLYAATGCVKATGECVAKAKWVIERIGDFEYEFDGGSLGIDLDLSVLDVPPEERERPTTAIGSASISESVISSAVSDVPSVATAVTVSSLSQHQQQLQVDEPLQLLQPHQPALRSPAVSVDKPLPNVPPPIVTTMDPEKRRSQQSLTASRPQSFLADDNTSSMASSISSIRPVLPPLPRLSTTLLPHDDYSPSEHSPSHDSEFHSFRSESMTASSSGTSSTYLSRDSESSLVSQTSTRATTPDITLVPRSQPSISDLSTAASSTLAEEVDDVESKLLEKTFAHELMFNKEGQVTGGSLQALVERLTTHESTPEAMFVSTFYLTFRLFCTPIKLAETLIDRFEYVGDAPHMSSPVRLRCTTPSRAGWNRTGVTRRTARPSPSSRPLPSTASAPFSLRPAAASSSLHTAYPPPTARWCPAWSRPWARPTRPSRSTSPPTRPCRHRPSPRTSWPAGQLEVGRHVPGHHRLRPARVRPPGDAPPDGHLLLHHARGAARVAVDEARRHRLAQRQGHDRPVHRPVQLVADTILHYPEVKKRAAVIKQWIKIAHQCLELNNYDALMAIICSLNSSTIMRLRRTWDAVSPRRRELLKTLQAVVDPSQNNKMLRTRLHDHVPPCLPFLGMFLTDLTFVDVGNPATKQLPGHDDGSEQHAGLTVVNFDKHTRTAKIIGEVQRFQIPYRLTEVPALQDWFQAQVARVRELETPGNNVQVSNYRKSLLLEPRETQALLKTPTVESSSSSLLSAPSSASSTSREGGSGSGSGSGGIQRTDLFGWMRGATGGSTTTLASVI